MTKLTQDKIDGFVKTIEKLQTRTMKYADGLNDDNKIFACFLFQNLDAALENFLTEVNSGQAYRQLSELP